MRKMGRRQKYDPAEIKRLWLEGKTAKEITAILGCHKNTISRVVVQLGLPRRYRKARNGDLADIENALARVRVKLKDSIKRARNVNSYCEWTARETVRLQFEAYQRLREMRRFLLTPSKG